MVINSGLLFRKVCTKAFVMTNGIKIARAEITYMYIEFIILGTISLRVLWTQNMYYPGQPYIPGNLPPTVNILSNYIHLSARFD